MVDEENRPFQERHTQTVIRWALLALLVLSCVWVLRPFINPIIGGVVVAIGLHAPYQRLTHVLGGRRKIASIVLVALILIALIVPLVILGASLVGTAADLSEGFSAADIAVPPPPDAVAQWPLAGERIYETWLAASRNLESALVELGPQLKSAGLWLVQTMGNLGWGLVMLVVTIVIGGALLSVEQRGVKTARRVATIVAGKRGPELADLVAASVQSVIRGVIGVALIQSILAGLGMLVAGVPGAGLWALLILLLAVIQLPAMLVLIPVVLYVFAVDTTTTAVSFAIWAVLVGASDNVLKPLLMGRDSRTPMLVLFMGSLGGFIVDGILGLFVGAVVLSIGYTVFLAWLEESDAIESDANAGAEPGS